MPAVTLSQKLAIGTAQFGLAYGVMNSTGQVTITQARDILRDGRGAGVDTLDTAVAYGSSESTLGACGVGTWRVITKLPGMPEDTPDVFHWLHGQVSESLSRLGVAWLHGLLLHKPTQLLGPRGRELYDALLSVRNRGLVKNVGISIYDPAELEPLLEHHRFDIVQAPVNILDRRLTDSGWARHLERSGIHVYARSAFLQGLLLAGPADRPEKFRRWQQLWTAWDSWVAAHDLTRLAACLRYVATAPGIHRVVVGVDSVAQLHQILAVPGVPLESLPEWPAPVDMDLIDPSRWGTL